MKRILMTLAAFAVAAAILPTQAAWTYEKGADVSVAAGETIDLPSSAELGHVTLAAGGTINLPSDGSTVYFISLNGAGKVATSFAGSAYSAQALQVGKPWSVPDVKISNFAGTFSGNIAVYGNWTLNLLGTESPFSLVNDNFICYHPPCGCEADSKVDYPGVRGVLGVTKFGDKRPSTPAPSSISTADAVRLSGGGTLRYLGTGESTTHDVCISYVGTIDAGTVGGLNFVTKGNWSADWYYDADDRFTRLTLAGDHTTPCTMSGIIRGSQSTASEYSTYITKEGTGTWYIKDGASRDRMRGPLAVREGTLQFDSVANTGSTSSLGRSDKLYDAPGGTDKLKDEYKVDYAFLIGGGKKPVFEHVGTNDSATDRKIEVAGLNGTISQAGTGSLALNGGLTPNGTDEATIHLTRAAEAGAASIRDLSDGRGILSVVKEGAGEWIFGGELSFSGLFEVKEGQATVEESVGPQPYTWFRLVLQEASKANAEGAQFKDTTIFLRAIGLFDENGNRICQNLEEVRPTTYDDVPAEGGGWVGNSAFNSANLKPGQFSLGGAPGSTKGIEYYKEKPVTQLFNLSDTWTQVRLQTSPALGNGSELYIVFRPPAGKVAKYYDVMNSTDWTSTGASHVSKWTLEGSIDGANWVKLHQVTEDPKRDGMRWSSTGVHPGYANGSADLVDANCLTAGFGYEIAGMTAGETKAVQLQKAKVKVAAGATLKAVVELSAIALDCLTGNGTFDGVTFAPNGTIDLVNAGRTRTVPLTLKNVDATSIANLKTWTLTVNGEASDSARLTINEAQNTMTASNERGAVVVMGLKYVDAATYGLSTSATAAQNTKAMNDALAGGNKRVKIMKPGKYYVNDTIYFDDNTELICAPGVVFERTRGYCHMFLNRAATSWDANAYNENITIRNLEIKDGGFSGIDGYDSPAKGMRGQIAFFKVKNVKVYNFTCEGFTSACYCIQFVDFKDILMDGFVIRGEKDGIHLNRGEGFVLRNGVLRTADDGIALNAGDWTLMCTPTMGSIKNGLIENVTDEMGGGCNFARVITGAWREWYAGMPLQRGDIFTVGTNVYAVAFDKLSTDETISTVAPTHTRGVETFGDIPFLFLQGDGETRADILNVTFTNCTLNANRQFSCSWEMCEYSRLVHPSLTAEELPVIDIKLIDVHKTTSHDYFIKGNGNLKAELINCSVMQGPLVYQYMSGRTMHKPSWEVKVNDGDWRVWNDPDWQTKPSSQVYMWVSMPSN